MGGPQGSTNCGILASGIWEEVEAERGNGRKNFTNILTKIPFLRTFVLGTYAFEGNNTENRPKTMKNHENRPGTMKNQEYRHLIPKTLRYGQGDPTDSPLIQKT